MELIVKCLDISTAIVGVALVEDRVLTLSNHWDISKANSLFEKAESQSWEFELTRDNPKELFSLLAMPEGTKDGLFICRLSHIKEVMLELKQMWKEETENGLDKK